MNILNLLNAKSWLSTFVLRTLINKGVKHGVTFLVGFLSGPLFTSQIQPLLQQAGIEVDVVTLNATLMATSAGMAGYIMNWAVSVLDKDNDGQIG